MKTIALTIALALASLTLAQASVTDVRDFVASDQGALTTACPILDGATPVACYEIGSSTEHHRWELDTLFARFGDVEWVTPWRQEDGYVARLLVIHGDKGVPSWLYGFSLVRLDAHDTQVILVDLGVWQE